MKRSHEDPSLELIGRSAAERRLDRFYNRQRSQLQAKASSGGFAIDSKSRELKDLPFQPRDSSTSTTTSSTAAKSSDDGNTTKKGVKDILMDISKHHLPRRNRFAKSLQLLTKLSISYLDDRNNAEFQGVGMNDFLRVYTDLDRIFVMEFAGNVPKDALDVKGALVDFIETVVDRLEMDASTSPNERKFLQLLKLSMGYSASLWYENDSFRFHAVISKLETHFSNFENIASRPDLFLEKDSLNVASESDGVDNSLSKAKTVGPSNQTTNDGPQNGEDTATSVGTGPTASATDVEFKLPTTHRLLELQKQAFVRTLAVVFGFFTFPWAKVSIETLFQRVYLKRDLFCETDQKRITEWQQQIKASKGKTFKGAAPALGISEANFQVKDAREEKIVSVHGSQVWCNRQYGI